MFEFGLQDNKNGKKTNFFIMSICLLNTNILSINFCLKLLTNTLKLTMNKNHNCQEKN